MRTLEELARIGRQRSLTGRSVCLRHDDIESGLLLDSVFAERIGFEHTSFDGALTVRSCHIEELVIDHLAADALLITNSRIGRLTIRNAPIGCDVTVTDTSVVSLDLHSCGAVRLQRLRVEQLVQLAALRGSLSISATRAAAVSCRSQAVAGRLGRPRVDVRGLQVSEELTFDDLWLSALNLSDVAARALTLRRVRLDEPLNTTDLRCTDSLRINGLVIPAGANFIADSDIRGPVHLRGLEAHGGPLPQVPARLAFRNTTMHRLSVNSEASSVISLRDSSVTGVLGLPGGGSRVHLQEGSSVNDLELSGQTFRNSEQVLVFLRRSFHEVSAVTLEALRVALEKRNRNREVDQLYYLTRQMEALSLPLLRRGVARGVVGGVLGWGVRVRNPVRALLAGVFLTAIGLHLSGALREPGHNLLSAGASGEALVLAAALWLNVGTGMASELASPGWSVLAVLLTVAGLLFSTLIVGVVIRRLVR
ncbi:hypothetical protein [Streptomyces xinghaiensis]|uniref:hypothetical protein n=1 Tax=Streptomyces xinghaiensis TaxID=1038928 RepID=UPI003437EE86